MIRKAQEKDIPKILKLLQQILKVHVQIRPDIFIDNTAKYTAKDIKNILQDENQPIYVYVDETDEVLGYAICILKDTYQSNNLVKMKIMYIDDLCIDENARGQRIGSQIFDFLKEEAKRLGCAEITLTVWEGNDSAKKFYEKIGMRVKETTMEYIL
ncbi:MAG: GNAT family N-acetyltransferase [Erysipelotrichaceae bacterium]|nr:GNAT family N-acetyltransferase [Erysipelotrichaceae bacterium]MDY6034921.1 GNAT family N-acetyltransferase [Bulleidia sp.]